VLGVASAWARLTGRLTSMPPQRVVVLADDLIWQTRLAALVESSGGEVVRARTGHELETSIASAERAVIDLTASKYDPVEAVRTASMAGLRVLCVGQHDDAALRKRALAAGADRVFAYRKLFEDGPATMAAWLATVPVGEIR
jgi:CheY-like chemotaxis protein